jgi:hypothetical protein
VKEKEVECGLSGISVPKWFDWHMGIIINITPHPVNVLFPFHNGSIETEVKKI